MRAFLSATIVTTLAGGILVWAGCGSSGEVITDPTAENDAGTSADATEATSSSGGPGTVGGDGGGDAGPSSSGPPGGDGGIDPPDAGPGGDTTAIACGATSCLLATDFCCVSEVASGGDNGYACVATDAGCPVPPGGGDVVSLKCSAQANCPANTVCCIRETNNGAASECKAACGGNEAQLCDPNAASTGCPANAACSNKDIKDWGELPKSFATCGGKGN